MDAHFEEYAGAVAGMRAVYGPFGSPRCCDYHDDTVPATGAADEQPVTVDHGADA